MAEEKAIDIYYRSYFGPLYDNPELDTDKPYVEILISCICGARYRLRINGAIPIPGLPSDNIVCRNCGEKANKQSISGSSGGLFNATIYKMDDPTR